jgi:hypothetical protein
VSSNAANRGFLARVGERKLVGVWLSSISFILGHRVNCLSGARSAAQHAGGRANKQKSNVTAEFTWCGQKIENKFLLLKGGSLLRVEKEQGCC